MGKGPENGGAVGDYRQQHKCSRCGRSDVRLYRYYGCFLRDSEIYCCQCAPAGLIEKKSLVPLCEDIDGSVWGYTSVPPDAIARFYVLPDA